MPILNTLQRKENAHSEGVWTAQYSGQNRLITGGQDEVVKLWEEQADSTLGYPHSYDGHTLGVVSVAVEPMGEIAASSALDSVIRVSLSVFLCAQLLL
jgi:WD repeat-containing protein 61